MAEGSVADRLSVMSMKRNVNIVVLIDALGWEYIKDRQFLNDLLPVRMPMQTVLGFSSGAIPTILTGVSPARHRHWNLFYYDPTGSPFAWLRHFAFLPDRILDNRYSRKFLKELGRRLLGLGKQFECCVSPRYLPYFNWVEKRSIYESGGITGAKSIFDDLVENQVPHRIYSYHHATDEQILSDVQRDLEETNTEFFFVYLSEMDMFLHTHCKDEKAIDVKIAWYESHLRSIFNGAMSIDSNAHIMICSDHGMTKVCGRYDLVADIEKLGLKLCSDYFSVYDSTMARFWFLTESARAQITDTLRQCDLGRILEREELERLGLGFDDNRYGDLIFLLNPGLLIAKSDFNGRGWHPEGMHGYHPEDPSSDAIFLSNRSPLSRMQGIKDLHSVMKSMERRCVEVGLGAK